MWRVTKYDRICTGHMNSDTKYQAHVHALTVFQERNGVGGAGKRLCVRQLSFTHRAFEPKQLRAQMVMVMVMVMTMIDNGL